MAFWVDDFPNFPFGGICIHSLAGSIFFKDKNPKNPSHWPQNLGRLWLVKYVFCWSIWDMDVSENSGFSPQIIHFNRVFPYKPSILGYPYFWKHLYDFILHCILLKEHHFVWFRYKRSFLLIRGPVSNFSVPGNDVSRSVSSKYLLGQLVGSPQLLRETLTCVTKGSKGVRRLRWQWKNYYHRSRCISLFKHVYFWASHASLLESNKRIRRKTRTVPWSLEDSSTQNWYNSPRRLFVWPEIWNLNSAATWKGIFFFEGWKAINFFVESGITIKLPGFGRRWSNLMLKCTVILMFSASFCFWKPKKNRSNKKNTKKYKSPQNFSRLENCWWSQKEVFIQLLPNPQKVGSNLAESGYFVSNLKRYRLVNQHANGKPPFLIWDTSSNGGFSFAMLGYQRVTPKNSTPRSCGAAKTTKSWVGNARIKKRTLCTMLCIYWFLGCFSKIGKNDQLGGSVGWRW